jgi:hypothetical protein
MEGTQTNEILGEEKNKKQTNFEMWGVIVVIVIISICIGVMLINAQIKKERLSHCGELNDTKKAYECCKMNTSPSYNCYNEYILPQRMKEDEERRAKLNLTQDSDEK